jgi:SAM-dependent MidA family methyltransferase
MLNTSIQIVHYIQQSSALWINGVGQSLGHTKQQTNQQYYRQLSMNLISQIIEQLNTYIV